MNLRWKAAISFRDYSFLTVNSGEFTQKITVILFSFFPVIITWPLEVTSFNGDGKPFTKRGLKVQLHRVLWNYKGSDFVQKYRCLSPSLQLLDLNQKRVYIRACVEKPIIMCRNDIYFWCLLFVFYKVMLMRARCNKFTNLVNRASKDHQLWHLDLSLMGHVPRSKVENQFIFFFV